MTICSRSSISEPVCRICHGTSNTEQLMSLCYCAGTIGLMHVSCLQRWLGASNKTQCELCRFNFAMERKPKPFYMVSFHSQTFLKFLKTIILTFHPITFCVLFSFSLRVYVFCSSICVTRAVGATGVAWCLTWSVSVYSPPLPSLWCPCVSTEPPAIPPTEQSSWVSLCLGRYSWHYSLSGWW